MNISIGNKALYSFALVFGMISIFTYFKKKMVKKPTDRHCKSSLSVVFPCYGSYNEEE